MVVPGLAAKRVSEGSKGLTGDVYVRKWTSVKGKGKKKKEVEHEIHFNPLTLAITAAAVAGGALTLGAALWFTQQKMGKTDEPKVKVIITKQYAPVYEKYMETIIDQPAYDAMESVRVPEVGHYVYDVVEQTHMRNIEASKTWVVDRPESWVDTLVHHDAITHQEERQRIKSGDYVLVCNKYGIPFKRVRSADFDNAPDPFFYLFSIRDRPNWEFDQMLYQGDRTDRLGSYYERAHQFKHKTKKKYGLDVREGLKIEGPGLFG